MSVDPDILLLDEPFAALDYQTRRMVNDDIYKIIKNEHKTSLLVTHDISEAIAMSDRIAAVSYTHLAFIPFVRLSAGSTFL